MNFGISGKRVLIVGGSKNIGAAIAKEFAKEDCKIVLVSRNKKKLKNIIHEIGGANRENDFLEANLLDNGEPTIVAKKLISKFNIFDIVVHNIGGALGIKDPLADVENWNLVWRFNVGIAIEMNKFLIPPMIKNKWGRIIHISSIAAEAGELKGGSVAYAASKAYLNSYVKGLGRYYADKNVIFSALMPGAVLSEGKYWEKIKESNPKLLQNYLNEHQSIGRLGTPEEIAPFAVFMASEQASFACGSIVPIDGGRI